MRTLTLDVRHESWPLREAFTISRGSKTTAEVIAVTVSNGTHQGHGEAVPYARYGETVDASLAALRALRTVPSRAELQTMLPAGAARNALDCALFDFECKTQGVTAAEHAGLAPLAPVLTCYTLSLATSDTMAAKAREVAHLPLLKLKLGGAGDDTRMKAVRAARPDARLVADANEAWTADLAPALFAAAHEARIELIEQPFPEQDDEILRGMARPVPVCADESLHTRASLPRLQGLYDAINIKLDKAGGITEALALNAEARRLGFRIMVGSMVATSLAAAPALLIAQGADWADLDGPLLLARDRDHGIQITNGLMQAAERELWG